MDSRQRAKATYYRRAVEKKTGDMLQRGFSAPCLMRCHYDEFPQAQPQDITKDLRALTRRAERRCHGVRYMAYAAKDPATGAPCLHVLIDLPRADCREISRLWRGGRVDLLQPNREQIEEFARSARALLDDETRLFHRVLFISRSAYQMPA